MNHYKEKSNQYFSNARTDIESLLPEVCGTVLEIGCGGGYNQQLYDDAAVTSFAGLDPNGALLDAARARAPPSRDHYVRVGVGRGVPVHLVRLHGEAATGGVEEAVHRGAVESRRQVEDDERALFEQLAARGLLLEPFDRAADALREVYGPRLSE